jgi:gliding motility-associated lipoprotein GldH
MMSGSLIPSIFLFRKGFLLFCLGWILTACDPPNYIFENDESFSDREPWLAHDSMVYEFTVKDTNRYYNLLLELDHHKKYEFENLYVKINTEFPDQKQTSQILNISLADATGQWYSDCRGKTCTFYLPLQEQAIFRQTGSYRISLQPWMRQDTIRSIYRVAFKVEKDGKRERSE